MTYIPQKSKKKNAMLILGGFIIIVILLILSNYKVIKDTVCHFAFFFEAVFYTFILSKFILPTYTYILYDNRLKIVKELGSKRTTECDIDVANIINILPYKEYKKQENEKIKCVYNYNANFLSYSCCSLVFEYSGICEMVKFEPSPQMISELRELIKNQSASV